MKTITNRILHLAIIVGLSALLGGCDSKWTEQYNDLQCKLQTIRTGDKMLNPSDFSELQYRFKMIADDGQNLKQLINADSPNGYVFTINKQTNCIAAIWYGRTNE